MTRHNPIRRHHRHHRGGALLAVLWLSAALATVAFAVAARVRAETERSTTLVDGMQARYLAEGAIQRTIISMLAHPNQLPSALRLEFPTGSAIVEILPEASRLDINRAPPDSGRRARDHRHFIVQTSRHRIPSPLSTLWFD